MGNKGGGLRYTEMENINSGKKSSDIKVCKIGKKCGGCRYQGMSYEEQLGIKQKEVKKLLSPFGDVEKIIGMYQPYHY